MTERYALTTGPGRLTIHKLDRNRRRDRLVVVRDPGDATLVRGDFPADHDTLTLDDLPASRECSVHILHPNLLKRLFVKPQVLRAKPSPGRLRVLISGSGRCGTVSLAHYLDGLHFLDGSECRACHESLWEYILPLIANGDDEAVGAYVDGFTHPVEAAPHFSLVPGLIAADHVVHLIRDGRRVVQSGLNRGWYAKDSIWNAIKPDFPGDAFEQCCRFWDHTNRNMANVADLTVRLEDLATSPACLTGLVADLGLAHTDKPFPLANTGQKASTFDHWSERERSIFADICGDTMTRHYPDWLDSTGA